MTTRGPLHRTLLGVAVLLSAGLVLGAFNPAPHSGGDNAGYLALAHGLLEGRGYVDAYDPLGAPHTKYPPLFPLMLAGLAVVGASTWVAFKALAGVATVVGVGFTFLWAERRVGSWSAFGISVLVAASAGVVYYSHWILSDPVFVLLTFVSLWALERGEARSWDSRWLALGAVAALCAYFTRSAGLPLLVAVVGWLALRRRFRALAWTAVGYGLPVFVWWLRSRGRGVGDYGTEFWLRDPYDPGLGAVGLGGLAARVLGNAVAYTTRHLPAAVAGSSGVWAAGLGLALVIAATWGWASRVRKDPGAAELFVPLYLGLVLLWPQVWGGDRFVLPLLPLLLLYSATALHRWTRRLGGFSTVIAAGVLVAVLLPALGQWTRSVSEARTCTAMAAEAGPFACYGSRVGEFVAASEWIGEALPEGAAVMSRKPRLLYVMSAGVPSRTFPFDPTPDAQLAEADAVGARYVLLDRWDGQASRFVGAAVQARPGAFCFLQGFGPGPAGSSQLLGILPPAERRVRTAGDEGGVTLPLCPDGYVRSEVAAASYALPVSSRIPLFSSTP